MNVTYRWKKAGQIKIKTAVVVRELERIRRKKNGELRAEDVIGEASSQDSPLHSCFEWDNTKAAQAYRIWQARHLISVILMVRKDDDDDEPLSVRAYVNIRDDDSRYYTTTVQAMSDIDMRVRVLAEALKELNSFRRKYADLKELAAVFAAMDEISA